MGEEKPTAAETAHLIEEYTQAALAVIVVVTTCMAIFIGRVLHRNHEVVMPPEWWTVLGLIVGFYFGQSKRRPVR